MLSDEELSAKFKDLREQARKLDLKKRKILLNLQDLYSGAKSEKLKKKLAEELQRVEESLGRDSSKKRKRSKHKEKIQNMVRRSEI